MLEREESVVRRLTERFGPLPITIQRERRIWVEVPRKQFLPLMTCLRNELGFKALCTVTGLDMGDQFQLIYHLADENGVVLCVKEDAPKSDPVFDTATDLYKGGVLYELEARNLLGLTIRGIPEDIRYPLPDHWPEGQYPLRKEWISRANKEENENGKSSDSAGAAASGAERA